MKDFQDKIAVITGGASGIGYAMAKRLADEGMKIVLADFEEEALGIAEDEDEDDEDLDDEEAEDEQEEQDEEEDKENSH